jgi:Spy/CpxP family protein refolding chaperone
MILAAYRLLPFFTQLYGGFTELEAPAADTASAGYLQEKSRMNPYIRNLALAGGVAVALGGINAFAQERPSAGEPGVHAVHGRQHGEGQRWLRGLDLTQAQRDQVFKIFHEQAPVMREHANAAREAGRELRLAATSPNFDRARARALADQQAKAMAEMAFLRADAMSRVVAVLTPEQRQKLQEPRRR